MTPVHRSPVRVNLMRGQVMMIRLCQLPHDVFSDKLCCSKVLSEILVAVCCPVALPRYHISPILGRSPL
jgi:hypothetical protein